MPFHSFAQFGSALCEIAGVPYPEPEPQSDGVVAFHLVFGDVLINLVHVNATGNDEAFMLVVFGCVSEECELQALRVALDSNFSMLGTSAPVFGRNPETGELVMRHLLKLSQLDAAAIYASMVRMAELVREWRGNPLLSVPESRRAGVESHLFV